MSRVELFDETFDPSVAAHVDLVVAPTGMGCRLVLHDSMRKQFVGLVEFPWTVRSDADWAQVFSQLLGAYSWLGQDFHSVRLVWDSTCYTLLPKEYYVPEEAKKVLQSVVPVASLDVVYTGAVGEDALLLYGVPSEMLNAARGLWADFPVQHSAMSLCHLAREEYKKGTGLLVYLATGACTAVLVREEALLACVPFWPSCAEDVLYRLAGICEANGLSVPELTYRIFGPGFKPPVADAERGDALFIGAGAVDDLLWQYMLREEGRIAFGERGVSYLLEKSLAGYMPFFGAMECA
ncbi:MAG: hypothetical protein CSA97_06110 [Bacteroidetes bacterium]|nr:MAG: hypothetical protein CSA97_06110 [Bacteroidota bacterium]